jgi:hypothetical protein
VVSNHRFSEMGLGISFRQASIPGNMTDIQECD